MKEFHSRLRKIDGKPYGVYKSLSETVWRYGDFQMEWTHVQGDPHASASRVRLLASPAELGIPRDFTDTAEKRFALSDFLMRRLASRLAPRDDEDESEDGDDEELSEDEDEDEEWEDDDAWDEGDWGDDDDEEWDDEEEDDEEDDEDWE